MIDYLATLKSCALVSVVTASLAISDLAMAEQVTLEAPDGSVNVTGDLENFENGVYTLQTRLGIFTISSDRAKCSGPGCPSLGSVAGDFKIAGSDTIGAELMPLVLKGYADSQGAIVHTKQLGKRLYNFEAIGDEGLGDQVFMATVEDKGSSSGFKALLAGEAHIGMSSRKIRRKEVLAFRDAGLGDPLSFTHERTLAADSLMVVTNPENPIDALSEQQISGLLSGSIDNWSAVGGPDLPVTVVTRDQVSGTFATIHKRFLEPYRLEMSPNAQMVPGNAEMAATVLKTPGAIGYTGFGSRGDIKPIGLVSSCGIISKPSEFATKTREYPLSRSLYLYLTNKQLPDTAVEIINFATSPAAAGIIEKSGFIAFTVAKSDQKVAAETLRAEIDTTKSPSQQALMRELYIDLQEWKRLSPTFRFRSGSSSLDNASQRDLVSLIEYVRDLKPEARIALVGFTDSDGSFGANRSLGLSRAKTVRETLERSVGQIDFDISNIALKSYSELNPVACNSDGIGQRLNRRVEVWIKG